MYMYMCNIIEVFKIILKNIVGSDKESKLGEVIFDILISVVQFFQGIYWYVFSVEELKLFIFKE